MRAGEAVVRVHSSPDGDCDPIARLKAHEAGAAAKAAAAVAQDWRSPDGEEAHVLIHWLESEVVARLQRLDAKLERLTLRMDGYCSGLSRQPSPAVEAAVVWATRGDSGPRAEDWSTGTDRPDWTSRSLGLPPGDSEPVETSAWHTRLADPAVEELEYRLHEEYDEGVTVRVDLEVARKSRRAGGDPSWGSTTASNDAAQEEEDEIERDPSSVCHRPSVGSMTTTAGGLLLEARKKKRHRCAECLWNFMDDPESSRWAGYYAAVMPVVIMTSAAVTLAQTIVPPPLCGPTARATEIVFESAFTLEIFLRFLVCPNQLRFFSSPHNIIDTLAALPLVLRLTTGFELPCEPDPEEGPVRAILLCVVPVLRILKTLRRFEKFRLLVRAFEVAFEALPICIFTLLVLTLVFSSAIYLVEPRSNVDSVPTAMWLTIVTMTTVGYGDITPESPAGSCIVAVLVICSVLYLAMPLGIVGHSFTEVWQDRDRILLMQRTRDRLLQWGYAPRDIPFLFDAFDKDGNRELSLSEFSDMIAEMRIGLSPRRIMDLFESFDRDGNGTVDDKEFVKGLFGAQVYLEVYSGELAED